MIKIPWRAFEAFSNSLERYNNSYAFTMEDFGAVSLKNFLRKRKLNQREFLIFSIKITKLLGQLPFTSRDAMELVDCHLAKVPVPPHKLKSSILTEEYVGYGIGINMLSR